MTNCRLKHFFLFLQETTLTIDVFYGYDFLFIFHQRMTTLTHVYEKNRKRTRLEEVATLLPGDVGQFDKLNDRIDVISRIVHFIHHNTYI